nr:transposase [Synechocystis sp. PCC 7338]
METSAELSYAYLNWCNSWYIHDDTLGEANTALINYHYCQPLSQLWGGGMLFSSDGQRLRVQSWVSNFCRSINRSLALDSMFLTEAGLLFMPTWARSLRSWVI